MKKKIPSGHKNKEWQINKAAAVMARLTLICQFKKLMCADDEQSGFCRTKEDWEFHVESPEVLVPYGWRGGTIRGGCSTFSVRRDSQRIASGGLLRTLGCACSWAHELPLQRDREIEKRETFPL